MKVTSQNRKTKYTQMALKESLIELMKEKPVSKITIKELCDNADINRTTFYAHYSDQYDLLQHIEEETLSWAGDIISSFSPKSKKEDMIKNLESVFSYISENRNQIQVLMSEQGDINFQKKLWTLIYEHCGVSSVSEQRTDLETRKLYFVFVVNGSIGLIQHWLKNGLNKSTEEMAEIIYEMTMKIR